MLAAHPGSTLDLRLSDQLFDLAGEGIDCAIGVAKLADSLLLARHNCVAFRVAHRGGAAPWLFRRGSGRIVVEPKGNLLCDTTEVHLAAARAGIGMIQTLSRVTPEPLARGERVRLLQDRSSRARR